MKFGIDRYIGSWKSEDGYRIDIYKISDTSAWVSFYNPSGEPIQRPYYENKSTIQMLASYDDYNDEFDIALWKPEKGFELNLRYPIGDMLNNMSKEVLIPSISRYEKDHFLDQYYELFGNFKDFIKI